MRQNIKKKQTTKKALKKAQVFSMIAIMMSLLFVLFFSSITHVPLDRKAPIVKEEVGQVDSFVKDIDRLVVNAIDQSAYGSLAQFALLEEQLYNINATYFFENFSQSFEDCFEGTTYDYNSSIANATNLPCDSTGTLPAGRNFSFSHYIEDLFYSAETLYDVNLSYSNVHAKLIPSDNPFYLRVNVSLDVVISRKDYSWNRPISVARDISINGIAHPLIMNRTIKVSPEFGGENFHLNRFNGNVSKVAEFITKGYYFIDNRSPSLVDLFNGNIPGTGGFTTANLYGIGSFIPANATYSWGPAYTGNTSSSVEYDYINRNGYDPNNLRRLSSPDININQTFPKEYITAMGFSLNGSDVKDVAGQCDDNGCN